MANLIDPGQGPDRSLISSPQTHTGEENSKLEIPIFGAEHAQRAVSLGAGRLELNADGSYSVGGITPSLDELRALRTAIGYDTVPIRIMIRPRGAKPGEPDFIYSTSEYSGMCQTVALFKDSGLLREDRGDGFVFGVLKRRGEDESSTGERVEVDIEKNTQLVNLARPFKTVFHRAFDDVLGGRMRGRTGDDQEVENEGDAVKAVKTCGFDGILTSGGLGNAPDNRERLGRILALAAKDEQQTRGRNIEIIVGGGVRSGNLAGLRASLQKTVVVARVGDGAEESTESSASWWFHSSCLTSRSGGLVFEGEEVLDLVKGLTAP